jgi:trk system potassium uptake protein TrkH
MQSSIHRRTTRLQARLHHWLTRPSPVRYVAVGYLAYMAIGWALLSLPIAQQVPVAAVDSLFIAVSAVSTTGLVSLDPGTSFTLFGEIAILALIQVGGLGFMTISSFAWAALSQPVGTLRERVARMVFSIGATEDIRRFLRRSVVFTLVVEAAGAAALYPLFLARGVADPAWAAIFHSVSAFCTAGFALFPDSLERFAADPLVLGVISLVSLLGALGFLVVSELWDRARGRRAELGVTSRLVLRALPVLILGGAALLLVIEPEIHRRPLLEAVLAALFQALSALGTVGLSLGATGELSEGGKLVIVALMVIGRIGVLGFAVVLAMQARAAAVRRSDPADVAL